LREQSGQKDARPKSRRCQKERTDALAKCVKIREMEYTAGMIRYYAVLDARTELINAQLEEPTGRKRESPCWWTSEECNRTLEMLPSSTTQARSVEAELCSEIVFLDARIRLLRERGS